MVAGYTVHDLSYEMTKSSPEKIIQRLKKEI